MKREREQELIASLQLAHKISLEEAKKQLGVSESTVRRLFEKSLFSRPATGRRFFPCPKQKRRKS